MKSLVGRLSVRIDGKPAEDARAMADQPPHNRMGTRKPRANARLKGTFERPDLIFDQLHGPFSLSIGRRLAHGRVLRDCCEDGIVVHFTGSANFLQSGINVTCNSIFPVTLIDQFCDTVVLEKVGKQLDCELIAGPFLIYNTCKRYSAGVEFSNGTRDGVIVSTVALKAIVKNEDRD